MAEKSTILQPKPARILGAASKLAALGVIWGLATGCAGHAGKTEKARSALDAGQPKQARTLYNKALGVKDANQIPDKTKKDTAILILDRGMISQALDDYSASSKDFQYADKELEILDMSRTPMSDVAKFIFSDDSGPYKATPYEKVMINTMNIVNYLAQGNLNGARIEARRMSIMQKYLRDHDNPAVEVNGVGGYLAGFVFERSGRTDIALRYYDEALEFGEFRSLVEPISRLSGGNYKSPRIREFMEKYGPGASSAEETKPAAPPETTEPAEAESAAAPTGEAAPEAAPDSSEPPATTEPAAETEGGPGAPEAETPAQPSGLAPAPDEPGDLLIIVSSGRVPAKVAKRIPIGLALTYASGALSPANTSTANRLAAQGLVSWVNFPELEKKSRSIGVPALKLDGQEQPMDVAVALDEAARKDYEKNKAKIVGSAITRMIARAVAGEAAGAGARAAGGKEWVGALVSVATQATLVAADTPDTRMWATLPARIAVTRVRLAPGKHKLKISTQGVVREIEVDMKPGGWKAAVVAVLR